MTLTFTVPGLPRSKERARHGKYGNVYTPTPTKNYEEEIWICAMKAGARQLCFGDRPLWLGLKVFMAPPKKPKYAFPTRRPDFDNLQKVVMDGLKHAFKDDAQVVGVLPGNGKFYGEPRIEIELTDNNNERKP